MKRYLSISAMAVSFVGIMVIATAMDFLGMLHAQDVRGASGSGGAQALCRECHEAFVRNWSASVHGNAFQPYSREFAQRHLSGQTRDIPVGEASYRVDISGPEGMLVEKGAWPWASTKYRMDYVLGGRNVYYFFTTFERGRLQTLPVAYDIRRREWIDTAASGGIRHARIDPASWKGKDSTFSSACFACHVSQVSTSYDFKTDTYRMPFTEPGLACETCHGPVEDHRRTLTGARGSVAPKDLKIISARHFTVDQHNTACAPCHAKVEPLTGAYLPGQPFFDTFDIACLEDGDFYPDGRHLGENHTYTTWLMNPCAASGRLDCMKCHTAGGGYRYKDLSRANDACMPCHEKIVTNAKEHTHHDPANAGSLCISCHMPRTGFDGRQHVDHSFLPPAPAATLEFKSPNACTQCHLDKSDAWADQWVRKWFRKDYQAAILHRSRLIREARNKDWRRLGDMLSYIQSTERDEVTTASLIRMLKACPDLRKIPVLASALHDRSPLVRSAATQSFGRVISEQMLKNLIDATDDPVRLVRIRAASALLQQPRMALPAAYAQKVNKATGEYVASLMVRQDQWTSHYNMGNYFLEQGDARNALTAYAAASRIDARAVPPYVSASIAHALVKDPAMAMAALQEALRLDPDNAPALFNMGLLMNEQGKTPEAVRYLREALENDPSLAAAAFNLSMILSRENPKEAIDWAARAYEEQPDAKYGYSLAYLLKQDGKWDRALSVLAEVTGRYPAYTDAYLLMGEIHEKRGRKKDAWNAYQKGLSVQGITDADRMKLERRIQLLR